MVPGRSNRTLSYTGRIVSKLNLLAAPSLFFEAFSAAARDRENRATEAGPDYTRYTSSNTPYEVTDLFISFGRVGL